MVISLNIWQTISITHAPYARLSALNKMMDYCSMLMLDEATARGWLEKPGYIWQMHPYPLCPIHLSENPVFAVNTFEPANKFSTLSGYEHGIYSPAPPMTYKTSMGWAPFAPTLWSGHLYCKLDDPDN